MLPNGIRIDHGDVKPPSNTPRPAQSNGAANGAAKAARIDADDEAEDDEFDWEVTPLIEDDADTTPIPWNIRGNDEEKVERVEKMINSAVEQCKTLTHRGVLTVPQSLIPRSKLHFEAVDVEFISDLNFGTQLSVAREADSINYEPLEYLLKSKADKAPIKVSILPPS